MSHIVDCMFEEFFREFGVDINGRNAHEYRQRYLLSALGWKRPDAP